MNLNVMDRIHLLNLLPREGDIITLKVVRQLRMDLSFSEEELKEFEIKTEEARIMWSQEKAKDKEIEFGETALHMVKETLKKLNDDKKLIMEQLELYDKFMEAK